MNTSDRPSIVRLEAILARTAGRARAEPRIHEARVYPDAADALVRIAL